VVADSAQQYYEILHRSKTNKSVAVAVGHSESPTFVVLTHCNHSSVSNQSVGRISDSSSSESQPAQQCQSGNSQLPQDVATVSPLSGASESVDCCDSLLPLAVATDCDSVLCSPRRITSTTDSTVRSEPQR
jgi:hypothetical protein